VGDDAPATEGKRRALMKRRRSALRRRYGHSSGEFDRLLSGQGPYYYEHDTDLKILQDVARPYGTRRFGPSKNIVFERHFVALADAGFIRWVQAHPVHTSLADDHYVLTSKGERALKVHREWVDRVIRGKRP
jgi:hypothetical protein